jgi:FkbM family methyltransferase
MKLALVGIITAVVSVGVYALVDQRQVYFMFRCWRGAQNPLNCYSKRGFDFTTDYFGFRWEGNTGNFLDFGILSNGAPERYMLLFLRDTMQRLSRDGQGVFIDVGANFGSHSLFMSRYVKVVHAFEPYEPALERLRRVIAINQVPNIIVHPVGLGDKTAKIPFFKPPDENQAMGSFVPDLFRENRPYHKLEIVVGDDALREVGVDRVHVIKIDLEGYEKPVLTGLHRTLISNRPVVHFELTTKPSSPVSFKSMDEIVTIFPHGYKFLVICPYGSGRCDEWTGRYYLAESGEINFTIDSQRNMVAYPAEMESDIPRSSP